MADFFNIGIKLETNLVTDRTLGTLMKKLNRGLGNLHKNKTMKKHFAGGPETVPGGGGYRYQRRSKKWNDQKRREDRGTTPLVYTGKLKEKVLSKESKVRATRFKWSYTAKSSFPMTQERRDELEIISRREERQYVKWIQQKFAKAANLPKYKRKRSVRVR